MARLEWHQAVKTMMKNVVKVTTKGSGYGSGVLVPTPRNASGNCCVLTAYHVVQKADETGATIEIELAEPRKRIVVPSLARTIFTAKDRDQALIQFSIPSPIGEVSGFNLLSVNRHYVPGVEFGWIGYPNLEKAKDTPCFMHGCVSAYLADLEAYLVDGLAIHGVSGGPVFSCGENQDVVLAGIVTNYYPEQIQTPSNGVQTWPGLSMFRTINPLMKLYNLENKVKPQQLPPIPPDHGNGK